MATPGAGKKARNANRQQRFSDAGDDDERAAVSKKISWILRRGAKAAGVPITDEGWVQVKDLQRAEILENIAPAALMQVIVDSNGKKLRYELREVGSESHVRAYSKHERRAKEDLQQGSPGKVDGKSLRGEATAFVPPEAPGSPIASVPVPPQPVAAAAHPYAAAYGGYPAAAYGGYPAAAYAGYSYNAHAAYYQQWQQYAMAHQQAAYAQQAAAAQAQAAWSQQQQQQPAQGAGFDTGRIKSFNPDKGFGFIDCMATQNKYGRDVFLHRSNIGEFAVGDVVSFTCEVNDQGMPQAVNVHSPGAAEARWMQKGGGQGGGRWTKGQIVGGDPAAGGCKGKKGKGEGKGGGKGAKGDGKKGKGGKGTDNGEEEGGGKEGGRKRREGKKGGKGKADGSKTEGEDGAKDEGNKDEGKKEEGKEEDGKKEDGKKEDGKKEEGKKEEDKKDGGGPKAEDSAKQEGAKKETSDE